MGDGRFRKQLAVAILCIWFASIVLNALDRSYNPPYELHGAAMAVVTWLYVARRKGD